MTEDCSHGTSTKKSVVVAFGEPPHQYRHWDVFQFERDFVFSDAPLFAYAFADWKPVVFDAIVLTAAIEYCDKLVPRRRRTWARDFEVVIPVHDPDHWNSPDVKVPLQDAVEFLTGDRWQLNFVGRHFHAAELGHAFLRFEQDTDVVLPFSDGVDSFCTEAILRREQSKRVMCVPVARRIGFHPSKSVPNATNSHFVPMTYSLKGNRNYRERSARSRGLKFAMVAGLAAYVAKANTVVIPESGQGCFAPALTGISDVYPDYRNHPLFTSRMELVLQQLLGKRIRFEFPHIWSTKGETVRKCLRLDEKVEWERIRSCWKDPRHSSVGGKHRQCGACAACLLRRLSFHAAGLNDPTPYICEDLQSRVFEHSLASGFKGARKAFREYAIAGVLLIDRLEELTHPTGRRILTSHATRVGSLIGESSSDCEKKLVRLVSQHKREWDSFLNSLGDQSFVNKWLFQGAS